MGVVPLVSALPKEQRRGGVIWDKKGHLRPLQWPFLKAGEGL